MAAWNDPRVSAGMKAQLARRSALLANGEAALGWKIGMGSAPARAQMKIEAPMIGYLLKSAQVADGGTISLKGWNKPVIEPEIAVHIGADLGADADRDSVRNAIAAIAPAFEIVDVTFAMEPEGLEQMLAVNMFQRHVVLGPPDASRAGGRVADLTGRLSHDGKQIAAATDPEATIGNLVDILAHAAGTLGAHGEKLRAGDVVITGSITPPLTLAIADTSLSYELEGVGSISVNFTEN